MYVAVGGTGGGARPSPPLEPADQPAISGESGGGAALPQKSPSAPRVVRHIATDSEPRRA